MKIKNVCIGIVLALSLEAVLWAQSGVGQNDPGATNTLEAAAWAARHSLDPAHAMLDEEPPVSSSAVGARQLKSPTVATHSEGATACHGGHTVHFRANLNRADAVTIELPEGQRLQGLVRALAISDGYGRRVWIGWVKDCQGTVVSETEVLYLDVFEGIRADVRFVYGLNSFEQDVILRQKFELPEGVDPATAKVEVWSEFFSAPEPRQETYDRDLRPNSLVSEVWGEAVETDEMLHFGLMSMVAGRAFAWPRAESNAGELELPTAKRWIEKGSRKFLVESADYQSLKVLLDTLLFSYRPGENPARRTAPLPPPPDPGRRDAWLAPAPMLAQSVLSPAVSDEPGVVLDYLLVNTALLNLDFGGSGQKTGLAAIGYSSSDYWNSYYLPNQSPVILNNLRWADQAYSGVRITVTNAPGCWNNSTTDPMYNSYVYRGGGPFTVHISDVPAGFYNLYLYGHGATNLQNSVFQLSVGTTAELAGGSATNYVQKQTGIGAYWNQTIPIPPWITNGHYVGYPEFQINAGDQLRITVAPDSQGYAIINGLQLVASTNGDIDGDNLPDAWERFYFGNLNQSSAGDPDGDGVNNLTEYRQGGNPALPRQADPSGTTVKLNVFTPLKPVN